MLSISSFCPHLHGPVPRPPRHTQSFHTFIARTLLSGVCSHEFYGPVLLVTWKLLSFLPSPAVSCCHHKVFSHQEPPTSGPWWLDLKKCHIGVGMGPCLLASDDFPWKKVFSTYLCADWTSSEGTSLASAERLEDGGLERWCRGRRIWWWHLRSVGYQIMSEGSRVLQETLLTPHPRPRVPPTSPEKGQPLLQARPT